MAKLNNGIQKWVTFVLVYAAVFLTSYARYSLAPVAGALMKDLNLSQQMYSAVYNASSWVSVLLGIFAGLLADRFGTKKVISIGFILTTIGMVWRVFSADYATLFVSTLLTGFVPTAVAINRSKIFGAWFKKSEMGIVMGISLTTTPLSSTLAMATTALFETYKDAFIIAAFGSVVMMILWFAFMEEKPQGVEFPPSKPIFSYLKIVSKNPYVWITGLALFFVFGAQVATTAFIPRALQIRGLEPVAAGLYATAITIGMGVGSVIFPTICKLYGKFKLPLFVFGIVGALSVYFSWQMPIGIPLYIVSLLAGFMIGGVIPVLNTFPFLIVGHEYASSAMGITFAWQSLGGLVLNTYIFVPIAGDSFTVLFALAAASFAIMVAMVAIIPELGIKKETGTVETKATL